MRRPLTVAAAAVVVASAGRRVVRRKPVEGADWCPDLVLARLAKRRAGDSPATVRSEPPAPPAP